MVKLRAVLARVLIGPSLRSNLSWSWDPRHVVGFSSIQAPSHAMGDWEADLGASQARRPCGVSPKLAPESLRRWSWPELQEAFSP